MITIPDNVLIIMNRCLLVLSQFVRQSDKLDYRSVAEKISQSAVEGLSISRASVWQLNPSLVSMECIALFVNDALVTGAQLPTLHEKDFPIYFKALQEERFVVANDARNDSDTCEFTESYLKPLNIFSMLDLPIRQDGKVVGILCCEQTDSIREWDLLSQNYAGMLADIAERALAEVAIKRLALFDPLTLLANRPKLLKDIRETEPTALIIFDITSFASINDVYGEKNGDLVLKHAATCLVQHTQHNGTLYRYGNDQFALLLATSAVDSLQLQAWALSICKACESVPCVIDDIVIPFSFVFSLSCEPKENLIVTANLVLKALKKSNMDYLCYDKKLGLELEIASNISWTKKIKEAIESKRVISLYQPIVDNRTQQVMKFESLVRIEDEKGELVSPQCFLEIAKKSKQYAAISYQVIENTFAQFRDNPYSFSINLTMEDMLTPSITESIEKYLNDARFYGRVIFELVESEMLEKSEAVSLFLQKIRAQGALIAIDDFGTGYSNFEYLIRLAPDFIKIDGSMIKDIHVKPINEAVVKTIIDFAKKQKIVTIAEYVSNQAVFEKVCELGINYSQGYYISEPKRALVTSFIVN